MLAAGAPDTAAAVCVVASRGRRGENSGVGTPCFLGEREKEGTESEPEGVWVGRVREAEGASKRNKFTPSFHRTCVERCLKMQTS